MNAYLQLVRNHPNFSRLWVAQVISLLGDWFSTVVLAVMVRQYAAETSYEGLAVSALFLSQTLPPLIASPAAGALVDRFDRKTLLVWSNLLRAGVVLGFLFVQSVETLWLLYTLRIVQFVLSSVFEPGQSALVPSLVPFGELTRANTLLSTTWSVMLAVGAVIGGIVGALFGAQVAIVVDALTFVVAAGIIQTIQPGEQPQPIPPADDTDDRSFAEALRYFRGKPEMIAPLTVKFGSNLGSFDTVVTFYATGLFVLGASGELAIGVFYSAFGVGALLGPLLLNAFHDGSVPALSRMVIIGFVWSVIGWMLLGAAGVLWVAVLAVILRAMGNSTNWVYSTTMIQKTVPDQYLGRAFALDMAGFYLASGTSLLLHGLLIDWLGSESIRLIVYGTGVVAIAPLLWWWLFVVYRGGRRVQQTAPGAQD